MSSRRPAYRPIYAPARRTWRRCSPVATCSNSLSSKAGCTGLEHKVGTLTPGKDADIVLLKAHRLNVWQLNSAPGENEPERTHAT
jgi:hypothetical protein